MSVIFEGTGVAMPPGGLTCKSFDAEQAEFVGKLINMVRNTERSHERERCAKIAQKYFAGCGIDGNMNAALVEIRRGE